MKKLFLSLAVIATLTMVSCKHNDTKPSTSNVDTIKVNVDTTKTATDTTKAKVTTTAKTAKTAK
jgi:hypothetical protein